MSITCIYIYFSFSYNLFFLTLKNGMLKKMCTIISFLIKFKTLYIYMLFHSHFLNLFLRYPLFLLLFKLVPEEPKHVLMLLVQSVVSLVTLTLQLCLQQLVHCMQKTKMKPSQTIGVYKISLIMLHFCNLFAEKWVLKCYNNLCLRTFLKIYK